MKNIRKLTTSRLLAIALGSSITGCQSETMVFTDSPDYNVTFTERPKMDGSYKSYKGVYNSIQTIGDRVSLDIKEDSRVSPKEGIIYRKILERNPSEVAKEISKLKAKGLDFIEPNSPRAKLFLGLYEDYQSKLKK